MTSTITGHLRHTRQPGGKRKGVEGPRYSVKRARESPGKTLFGGPMEAGTLQWQAKAMRRALRQTACRERRPPTTKVTSEM